MSRLAYLRGQGVEISMSESRLPEMTIVAKNLGLRRLAPIHSRPNPVWYKEESFVLLLCSRCGKMDKADKMLANLDGDPYRAYEHERCPISK